MNFQPGEAKNVTLVSIGGLKIIRGGNGIVDGLVDTKRIEEVMLAVHERAFGNKTQLDTM